MGITISCNKTGRSCDLGYAGFGRFRQKVAELYSKEFGAHYALLSTPEAMWSLGKNREAYFEAYDARTKQMIADKRLDPRVADFCYQCDCDGKIKCGACKVIYSTIKDYDDNIIYGYAGRPDRATFSGLKSIFADCVANRCGLSWS